MIEEMIGGQHRIDECTRASESGEHESETDDEEFPVQQNSASAHSHGCTQQEKSKTQTGKNNIKTRLTWPASLEMTHFPELSKVCKRRATT